MNQVALGQGTVEDQDLAVVGSRGQDGVVCGTPGDAVERDSSVGEAHTGRDLRH
jgi:hypothetical protein